MTHAHNEWSNERISDRFASMEKRINGLPDRVTRMETDFRNFDADLTELKAASHAIVARFEHREQEQIKERKQDRRWLVGSSFTAAGLVIAALGLLADRI